MERQLEEFALYLNGERKASHYTIRNYISDLQPFLEFANSRGVSSPDGVGRELIRAYLTNLAEQMYSKRSIARKLSALRSFFRFLLLFGKATRNVAASTSSPKLDKPLPEFLQQEAAGRLLEAPNTATDLGIRDRAILEVVYAAGLRVSEVVGIDVGDINISAREVRVLGKGNKERLSFIGRPAQLWVKRYLSEVRPNLLQKPNDRALFLSIRGDRLNVRSIQLLIKRYSRIAGLSASVHTHTVRHSFATHMLDGGADLRVVQELLGHTSLGTTQIYTHITQAEARKVYLNAHPLAKSQKRTEDQNA